MVGTVRDAARTRGARARRARSGSTSGWPTPTSRASIAHVRRARRRRAWSRPRRPTRWRRRSREVGATIADGTFEVDPSDEDVHSAVERGVTERLGDLGAKLHAGRSRNDLVITDLRLWLLGAGAADRAPTLAALARDARRAGARARDDGRCPGRRTRGRAAGHARPPSARARVGPARATWSGSTAGRAARDGLAARARARSATSTLGLDAVATAERLGFARAFENSIDAVGDRDVVQEFLAVAAICGDARVAAGGGPGAVDRPGARVGRARRGVRDGVEHDAAEAEPRHRRARARRRPRASPAIRDASRRCCRACRSATTATSRRTRSRRSTRPTRSGWCCRR